MVLPYILTPFWGCLAKHSCVLHTALAKGKYSMDFPSREKIHFHSVQTEFFISIFVIKWLRISYAQFTVRQVRKSEDIETWIPACTVLPKAKIIAKRCNLINLIIGVDYKAFWKFSYWSDNFSEFFLNREYCHNSSAKQNTLSYIPFISNHMFGINWYFLQCAHSSIETVIFL